MDIQFVSQHFPTSPFILYYPYIQEDISLVIASYIYCLTLNTSIASTYSHIFSFDTPSVYILDKFIGLYVVSTKRKSSIHGHHPWYFVRLREPQMIDLHAYTYAPYICTDPVSLSFPYDRQNVRQCAPTKISYSTQYTTASCLKLLHKRK